MFKKLIISFILLLAFALNGFSQITYFNLSGGGSFPAGWNDVNNVTSTAIDRGSYFMLQPGSPGDVITTSSYDLCTHTSATFTVDITSFGSGTHRALKVEASLDGGATYTQTYITNITTGSYAAITPIIISPVSSNVVIRLSVNATNGRGIRMRNIKLVGNGAIPCGGGTPQTVIFDGNGSDGGSMSNQTASSSTALTSNSFSQTGCTFIEWNTASDGSGTSYADAATYSFSADITLFAQWNCGGTPQTVTFDGNGNDGGSMSNQTASTSTLLTTNTYTQTGCTFTEWNTASDGSGTSYADAATYSFSADITLFAQWNCPPSGGNCIDEDFVDFSDWTNSGTATDNVTSHAGLSIPCRALGSGDELISPAANNPTQLQFYQDASGGGSGNTALVEYSIDGGTTWVTCHTFNVTSAGGIETVNLTNVGGVDLSTHTGVLFKFSSSFSTWYLDDVVTTCGTPTTNTITTGVVSGSPFSVMCGTSDNGSVVFTSTDPFTGGNIYTAQLSNSTGSFASPTSIGTLTSTANSGTINITIPAGTINGTGYKIRVVSSTPSVTGTESSSFSISLTDGPCATACPELTGILVDACGGAIEGINELFTFTNGNSDLYIDSLSTTFPTAGTYCNSGCGALNWVTNSTFYVDTLNATASCPGLFVEADPIPANGKVIVFTGKAPTFKFDFGGLCGNGPYYAVFANNTSTGGRFANYSGCSVRTLRVDFGSNCSDTVSYDRCLLSDNDGDFITYDAAGNATYNNDGCTPTTILPITLLNFEGNTQKNGSNLLTWTTTSEINNDFFTIERSLNAISYEEVGEMNGAGNSNSLLHYNFIDNAPNSGINYYRLKQTDFDGDYSYSHVIALNNAVNKATIFVSNNVLQINFQNEISTSSLQIIDAVGRIVYSNEINTNTRLNTSKFPKGIYIIKVASSEGQTIQKVKF